MDRAHLSLCCRSKVPYHIRIRPHTCWTLDIHLFSFTASRLRSCDVHLLIELFFLYIAHQKRTVVECICCCCRSGHMQCQILDAVSSLRCSCGDSYTYSFVSKALALGSTYAAGLCECVQAFERFVHRIDSKYSRARRQNVLLAFVVDTNVTF